MKTKYCAGLFVYFCFACNKFSICECTTIKLGKQTGFTTADRLNAECEIYCAH